MYRQPALYPLAIILLAGLIMPAPATAQCILSNPSFELGGSVGTTFGGWNQFGVVGSVDEATHGSKAARVSGPNYGGWDVSGIWQNLDSEPGQQWQASGHVRHPSATPLIGQSIALVNIEWHDAAGLMISYESFTVADASSVTDEYFEFSVLSNPAPTGTASTHFLLGVLQSPTDASPDVYYDQVTFYQTSTPTIDDMQWLDFNSQRDLSFGGLTWKIKGPGLYDPGHNVFSDASDCVWVDELGRLHLTSKFSGGTWTSTEVVTEEALGYGDYILTSVGRLDLLDPEVVLGIFLWSYGPCWDYSYLWWNAFNEIDIEYSRWGDPARDICQFVAQPYDFPGNISRFDATFVENEVTSHAIRWLSDRVQYRVWRGGPADEAAKNMIHSWTYTGPHIPRPENPRLHLNLWKYGNNPTTDQEVIFTNFTFIPDGHVSFAGDAENLLPPGPGGRLFPPAPNPFNPQTTVKFNLVADEYAELNVYDMSGHLVRVLARGHYAAGEHWVSWNGKDDHGLALASGVYLLGLRGDDFMETQRVSLIK